MRHAFRAIIVALTLVVGPGGTVAVQGQSEDPAVAQARHFLELLRAETWEEAAKLISPAMPAQLQGPAALQALWGQVKGSVGELTSLEFHRVEPTDSAKAVEFIGSFGAQRLLVRVVLTPAGQVSGFWLRPPPPDAGTSPAAAVVTAPYIDRSRFTEVPVELGHPDWRLGGTLALPASGGRHPAVVLVHGSGPHGRDGAVGGVRFLADLAQGLASAGVAVLRYDKRSLTHGARMTSPTPETEVIEDALAALALVRQRPEVDPSRVYLAGHSLGGMLGPEIAKRDDRLAGLVLLAAPARDLRSMIRDQLDYLATLPQNQTEEAQARLAEMRGQLARLESPETPDSEVIMGAPASYFRALARFDPLRTAMTLDIPILVLHGMRDYQVPPVDAGMWAGALGYSKRGITRSLPGLNHLFVRGTGAPNPAEYAEPGFVAPEVLQAIREFIGR